MLDAQRYADSVEVRGTGAFLTALSYQLFVHGHGDAELTVLRASLEDAYVNLLGTAQPAAGATHAGKAED